MFLMWSVQNREKTENSPRKGHPNDRGDSSIGVQENMVADNTAPAPLLLEEKGVIPTLALRPREAAKALGLCERTLWTMTQDGQVPHLRCGRLILYPVDSLRVWLTTEAAKTQPNCN